MKKVVLFMVAGIGNIVEATPMAVALEKLGYVVEIVLSSNFPGMEDLLPWKCYNPEKVNLENCYDIGLSYWARGNKFPDKTPDGKKLNVYSTRLNIQEYSEIECNMDVARQMGYEDDTPATKLVVPKVKNPVDVSNYVVICPGYQKSTQHANWSNKAYPRWGEVIELIDKPVVVVGTEDENEDCFEKADINMCGKTDLLQLAKILSEANGVIACDNGPAHMADAYKVPTVVLFGPTSTLKNAYYQAKIMFMPNNVVNCRPCQQNIEKMSNCKNNICMKYLEPKQIVATLNKAMEE